MEEEEEEKEEEEEEEEEKEEEWGWSRQRRWKEKKIERNHERVSKNVDHDVHKRWIHKNTQELKEQEIIQGMHNPGSNTREPRIADRRQARRQGTQTDKKSWKLRRFEKSPLNVYRSLWKKITRRADDEIGSLEVNR